MTADEVSTERWVQALRPVSPPYLAQLSSHSSIRAWHVNVEFEEWTPSSEWVARWADKNTYVAETWQKRPLAVGIDSAQVYSCGEVEIVARLRGAGMEAYWISEWSGFEHVPFWRAYCVKRSELRERLPSVFEFDQELRSSGGQGPALGARGGHPDIVAWNTDANGDPIYLEYKGPNDSINAKQNAWAQALNERVRDRLAYAVVRGAFHPNSGSPASPLSASTQPEAQVRAGTPLAPPLTLQATTHRKSGGDPLHRRTIRAALVRERGWSVTSRVDGSVDILVPPGTSDVDAFLLDVVTAVRSLGYAPVARIAVDTGGRSLVRLHTKETLEQSGRGAHTR